MFLEYCYRSNVPQRLWQTVLCRIRNRKGPRADKCPRPGYVLKTRCSRLRWEWRDKVTNVLRRGADVNSVQWDTLRIFTSTLYGSTQNMWAERERKMERSGPENRLSGSGTWKNTVERERSGRGRSCERERSGERAELAAHNPLKPNSWLF